MKIKIQLKTLVFRILTSALFLLDLRPAFAVTKNEKAKVGWEQSIMNQRVEVADWISGAADGLDLFLVGRRLSKEKNKSSATLETSAYYTELEGLSYNASFNVNLSLPNFEEYWLLTFTSYDELSERSAKQTYLRQTKRETNYGASVGFFKKLGQVRTSFRPRVTVDRTPAISHSLGFESVAETNQYRINPKLEFYATPTKGAGSFQSLNFNWDLNKVFSLTFINEGDYIHTQNSYTVTHGLSFGHFLSPSKTLSYNAFTVYNNRPNYQIDSYNLAVIWKQVVFKDVLDYQVIPNLDFNRQQNFVLNSGITLNIDIHF